MDVKGYSVLQLKGMYLATINQLEEASDYEAIMPKEKVARIKVSLIDQLQDIKMELQLNGVSNEEMDYLVRY